MHNNSVSSGYHRRMLNFGLLLLVCSVIQWDITVGQRHNEIKPFEKDERNRILGGLATTL